MKKSMIVMFVCLLGFSTMAVSQVQFALGVKAGPNFANIDTKADVGENYKNRTGFHGGAFALIKLTKIGIQPEILFSQQGSTVKINSQDFDANYSYVNIPVILKLYLIGGLNLQAGPQFGFVTNAEQDVLDFQSGAVTTEDIKDQLKGMDLSAALGLGWDLPFGLTLDARYNLGLSDISDFEGSQTAKNQVFQLSVGFKLIKFGK
jgi:hypothetical protein